MLLSRYDGRTVLGVGEGRSSSRREIHTPVLITTSPGKDTSHLTRITSGNAVGLVFRSKLFYIKINILQSGRTQCQ